MAHARLMFAALGVALAIAGFAYFSHLDAQDVPQHTYPPPTFVPDFRLTYVAPERAGQSLDATALHGHVTILNFLASWCSACKEEETQLLTLARRGDVDVYGIATHDTLTAVRADASILRLKIPVLFDADDRVAASFGVKGLPQTFVIGADGRILRHNSGALTDADIAAVEHLIQRSGSRP